MASSGMRPVSMPRAMWHSPATTKINRHQSSARTKRGSLLIKKFHSQCEREQKKNGQARASVEIKIVVSPAANPKSTSRVPNAMADILKLLGT